LVEKLLTECPDIERIYILLRPKHGHSPQKRLDEFVQSSFFKQCGRIDTSVLKDKISAVVGDITIPELGLSSDDRQLLIDNVSIVFHSAASVKFDDPLK
jgi:fatty acyl-CoA reductase